jgi:protein required for attachment to host cells
MSGRRTRDFCLLEPLSGFILSVMKTLVVIAESSRARILSLEGNALTEIEDLAHEASRAHSRDLGSDQPGRSFDSAGGARHAMGKESDPHDQESLHFAQQIAKRLEVARNEGQCSAFMIAAPPEFLGKLRKELSEQTAKLVVKEIAKSLLHKSEEELLQYIRSP